MKTNRLIYLLLIILFVWLIFLSRDTYFAHRQNNDESIVNEYNVTGFSTDFTKIIDDNKSSIVTIVADSNISTGFICRQNNDDVYIVTCYHGVSSANEINVVFASSYSQFGELIGFDPFTDLAVIKVETPYQMNPLVIGDSNVLKQGEFVISIGTPVSLDYASSVELGMISLKNITVENNITYNDERYSYYLNMIELSSDLTSGYSGSPILNMNGELVGMNTMNISSNFDFALTSNEIRIVTEKIINGQAVNRNNIGIRGTYLNDMYNYEKTNLNIPIDVIDGVYVYRIKENSLAYQAGVRSGDIITRINGKEIKDFNDYLAALYFDESNEMTFEYIHNTEVFNNGVSRD